MTEIENILGRTRTESKPVRHFYDR